jgi:hypothetical protein
MVIFYTNLEWHTQDYSIAIGMIAFLLLIPYFEKNNETKDER